MHDTIQVIVVPPYPDCIAEVLQDDLLEDCWCMHTPRSSLPDACVERIYVERMYTVHTTIYTGMYTYIPSWTVNGDYGS